MRVPNPAPSPATPPKKTLRLFLPFSRENILKTAETLMSHYYYTILAYCRKFLQFFNFFLHYCLYTASSGRVRKTMDFRPSPAAGPGPSIRLIGTRTRAAPGRDA